MLFRFVQWSAQRDVWTAIPLILFSTNELFQLQILSSFDFYVCYLKFVLSVLFCKWLKTTCTQPGPVRFRDHLVISWCVYSGLQNGCREHVNRLTTHATHLWTFTPLWRLNLMSENGATCESGYENERAMTLEAILGSCSQFKMATWYGNLSLLAVTAKVGSKFRSESWVEWQSRQPFCKPSACTNNMVCVSVPLS